MSTQPEPQPERFDFSTELGRKRYAEYLRSVGITPATEWERQIDALMLEQARTVDPARRREIFNDVQRIFAENLPVLYFAAPRLYVAHSTRLTGVVPSVQRPPVLWSADTLAVKAATP